MVVNPDDYEGVSGLKVVRTEIPLVKDHTRTLTATETGEFELEATLVPMLAETVAETAVAAQPTKKTRREGFNSTARESSTFRQGPARLPSFFVELLDLMHASLQVCVLNRAVEIDRIAISLFELVQMQRTIVHRLDYASPAGNR